MFLQRWVICRTGCVWDFPEDYRNTLNLVYSISRMLIGFVIPLGVICFCYFNIILFLRKRNKMFKKNFKGDLILISFK